MFKIDIHGLWNPLCIRLHDHHLARPQDQGIPEPSIARQTQASLQDEHLDVLTRNIFHHNGRAGDGCRDRGGVNLCAAQALRHLQKHRAFLQRHVARASFETKERFGADAGQRIILEKQFRARSLTGLQAEIIFNDFTDSRRALARGRVDHRDTINDLRDFRRLEGAGEGLVKRKRVAEQGHTGKK